MPTPLTSVSSFWFRPRKTLAFCSNRPLLINPISQSALFDSSVVAVSHTEIAFHGLLLVSIAYVVPDDLIRLYEPDELIQATNLYDAAANQIDLSRLQEYVNNGNAIAYGYMAVGCTDASLQVEALSDGLKAAFKAQVIKIIRALIDDSSDEIRMEYDKAIAYFKSIAGSNVLGVPADVSASSGVDFAVSKTWTSKRVAGLF